MNYIKLVLIGGLLSVVLLGFGGVSTVVGVDSTAHGWTLTPGTFKYGRVNRIRKITDKTRLYGPGLIIGGLSAVAAGILVIPSAVMIEQGKRHRLWPSIVVAWKIIRGGLVVGFGCAIVAGVLGSVL